MGKLGCDKRYSYYDCTINQRFLFDCERNGSEYEFIGGPPHCVKYVRFLCFYMKQNVVWFLGFVCNYYSKLSIICRYF